MCAQVKRVVKRLQVERTAAEQDALVARKTARTLAASTRRALGLDGDQVAQHLVDHGDVRDAALLHIVEHTLSVEALVQAERRAIRHRPHDYLQAAYVVQRQNRLPRALAERVQHAVRRSG